MSVKIFVENIYDYPINKNFISKFINNKELDIIKLFDVDLFKLNITYCIVWNKLFSTYPTKLDFFYLVKSLKLNLDSKIEITKELIYELLKSFKIVNYGLLNLNNYNNNFIIDLTNYILFNINNTKILTKIYSEKISYRFQNNFNFTQNVYQDFIKLYNNFKDYKNIQFINKDIFTKSLVFIDKNVLDDLEFLNVEYIQYVLYQNNNFLLKLILQPFILIQTNNKENIETIDNIILFFQKIFNKIPIICSSNENFKLNKSIYYIEYIQELFYMIPKISHFFLCITHTQNKIINSISIKKENSMVLLLDNILDSIEEIINNYNNYNRILNFNKSILDYNIYKLYNTETFWKYHIKENDKINKLIYIDFMYRYNEKIKNMSMEKNKENNTENVIILIDNRINELSVISAKIAFYNVKKELWKGIIFTSQMAYDYYKTSLGDLYEIVIWDELNNPIFDIDLYNDILQSSKLWKFLYDKGYKKCLIIQDDGLLVKKGVEKFLVYDYIGAPWIDSSENEYIKKYINKELVGNGGISLRSISEMIKITENVNNNKKELFFHNLNRIPEDVYFVKYLIQNGANIAPFNIAKLFSSEEILDDNSICIHKIWSYHPLIIVNNYLNNIF